MICLSLNKQDNNSMIIMIKRFTNVVCHSLFVGKGWKGRFTANDSGSRKQADCANPWAMRQKLRVLFFYQLQPNCDTFVEFIHLFWDRLSGELQGVDKQWHVFCPESYKRLQERANSANEIKGFGVILGLKLFTHPEPLVLLIFLLSVLFLYFWEN